MPHADPAVREVIVAPHREAFDLHLGRRTYNIWRAIGRRPGRSVLSLWRAIIGNDKGYHSFTIDP